MSPLPMLIDAATETRLRREVERRIPAHMHEGFLNYVCYGVPPGRFLHAVLINDFNQAARRADDVNQGALYNFMFVLWNFCPHDCWGSVLVVREWIAKGLALRRQQEPDVMQLDEVRRG